MAAKVLRMEWRLIFGRCSVSSFVRLQALTLHAHYDMLTYREEFGMITYRTLHAGELARPLFQDFIRRQTVTRCMRREQGRWVVKDAPFIDDWSEEDYETLLACLKHTAESGGFLYAAFADGSLKGFTSVEAAFFGSRNQYLDLSCIHVSADMRGTGIGRVLFTAAKQWAKEKGAGKLYISSHSAIESQAFYEAMGCTDAEEYNQMHVEQEPFDRQLECTLA